MAPSNTELLFAIGAQDGLSGVCTQCDYPPEVTNLPRTGNFEMANMEKLATIRPDAVFVVNGQEAMQAALEKQTAFRTRAVLLRNDSIDAIAANVSTLGAWTGHQQQADKQAAEFRDSVDKLRKVVAKAQSRPKVFFCVWPEPLVAVGKDSYLNDALTICGGTNVAAQISGAYPRFNVERLIVEQPDVIIMPAEADRAALKNPPWTALKAVQAKRLYFLPSRKDDRLSRPTLRTIEGLYWLAQRLHPELSEQLSMSKNSIRHLSATSPADQ